MAYKGIDADKPTHTAEVMRLSFNREENHYSGACPVCNGYILLTKQQAAAGQVRCFGNVILVSWPDEK